MKIPAVAMSKSVCAQEALDAFSSSCLDSQHLPADHPHLRDYGAEQSHLLVIIDLRRC